MPSPNLASAEVLALAALVPLLAAAQDPAQLAAARPRLRDLGCEPGVLPPGRLNAITDVAGVLVGHETVVAGDAVRTGVTAILVLALGRAPARCSSRLSRRSRRRSTTRS